MRDSSHAMQVSTAMDDVFRLCTYSHDGGTAVAGVIVGEAVYPLSEVLKGHGAGQPATVLDLLCDAQALAAVRAWAASASGNQAGALPLARVQLLAPLLYPGTVYCAGANYADHIAEMARVSGDTPAADQRAAMGAPWHFLRPSRGCIVGPDARIARPADSAKLDWEVELAAVIGTPTRNVNVEQALGHVAAYAVAIDLSARDLSRRAQMPKGSPFHFDWLAHKGFEGSCPLGPWLTPASAIRDPQQLAIRLDVNGQTMQDSNTSEMIFSVAEQIAHISRYLTLHPGDVVLTGTPAGVGSARGRFLQAGDEVSASIQGLGRLDVAIA
jgi:2-keto-4-pentenoate hydratase/2-oxohepta-3-ene-1,7-dioic acid hydratase in catechol pathway